MLVQIDGFPRSLDNLQGWESVMGHTVNVAFMLFFECPLKKLTDRILGRAKYSGREHTSNPHHNMIPGRS